MGAQEALSVAHDQDGLLADRQNEVIAWLANLDNIAARKPSIVVPGHMTVDSPIDLTGITHTKGYLTAFEEELAKVKDAAALNAAMKARYPNLGMGIALDIGAKVAKGEMKWG